MILGVLVRTVLRWSGATCRIALSFHFRLLAPGVGARSLASRWLNLCLLPAWNWIALDDFFLLVTLGAMRAIAAVKPRPPSHVGRVPPLRSAERVSSGAARGSRLPNGGEGRRDQQLVFLADRTDAGLCRPCASCATIRSWPPGSRVRAMSCATGASRGNARTARPRFSLPRG